MDRQLRPPSVPTQRPSPSRTTGTGIESDSALRVNPGNVHPVGGYLGRVLVVDDDLVIRQLISVNLELAGFEVATAVDGQDCLDKVKDVAPSVITLDIMMPRLDGWAAAARLRADPATAGMKLVLLSARSNAADVQRGAELGVDAYLTKPFDPDELIATVSRLAQPCSGLRSAAPAAIELVDPAPVARLDSR